MSDSQRRSADDEIATGEVDRREFLKQTAAATVAGRALPALLPGEPVAAFDADLNSYVIRFDGPDSLYHGHGWESLNPGYWKVENGTLRRRLVNVGDRARATGFPFHAATRGESLKTDYDPSLPAGILYRRDWRLSGRYAITAKFTYRGPRPEVIPGDDPNWKMYQDGYGFMGLAFGAKSLFESYSKIRHAIQVGWTDDGRLRWLAPNSKKKAAADGPTRAKAPLWQPGEELILRLEVTLQGDDAHVTARIEGRGEKTEIRQSVPRAAAEGYVGIVGRGLIDFEVNELTIEPGENQRAEPREVDCYACYPLGNSLQLVNGKWCARFVGLFATDGRQAELRIADAPNPEGGWQSVPVAGCAAIVNHQWRRNTAVIHATLPVNPAEKALYYTVWKDGTNVTSDPRIGTAATGPGTGMVGDVPTSGDYIGRLPQLTAPYKLCGLSCHAINSGLQQRTERGLRILGGGDEWQIRDQPTVGAYRHLDDYNFQIMVWEDDVWYMELVLYPPSTDDAFKIVQTSICGPTSRWQLMRHWNVINPGDHDYGMDDVKGPEQIAVRRIPGLGQDPEYMKRNFQIVHHLITGDEEADPLANPKKWRAWKMPNCDFTLVILDSRLWRSSQDVDIWDDNGWGHFKSIYDRTDPTRSLLGEEQFGWLQELLATDSSRLICLTGINGLHTIWTGGSGQNPSDKHPLKFSQRDRVTADYAGWVKAGADRVLKLLGSREGVVTVYGDVHNGCIMKNTKQGVIECSFGPIGRSGGRGVIPGFGPRMKDVDGRQLETHALYHKKHANPKLEDHADGDPFYWNFLEMEFDPRALDPQIGLRLRNMIDPPGEKPRGGAPLETVASTTGRRPSCRLPKINTLPNADVRFAHTNGRPLRGARSLADGVVPVTGLVDVQPGTKIIVTAFDGQQAQSTIVTTKRS